MPEVGGKTDDRLHFYCNLVMNVFIVGSPMVTAAAMAEDTRRYNKQIIECQQMLDAIDGKTKAWANHPCTLQYKSHKLWLDQYRRCFIAYKEGKYGKAFWHSTIANFVKPHFHTRTFYNQMKRRLFTKSPYHYSQWASLGTDHENWYWSPKEKKIIKYVNGKRRD